jgi:predicted dehydrogenase
MRVWSIGIVGAGAITRLMHLPVLLSMSRVRIAWIVDADVERARTVATAYGLSSAVRPRSLAGLPPADVVLLAIPVGVRSAYYEALAKRGTAVFAEKPFAVNAAEHKRIIRLFGPDRLACGYVRRTFESSLLLRRALCQGWFGPLRRIRISEGARGMATGTDNSAYDDFSASGGGVLMTIGTHSLDLVLHLTDATGFDVLQSRLVMDGKIDRKVEARVRLNGVSVAEGDKCELDYCVSWLDRQENVIELQFAGARLCAGITVGSAVELRCADENPALVTLVPSERGARTPNQAFFLEWNHFLNGLEAGRPSLVSAQSAVLTADLVDQLYRSARDRA